MVFVCVCLCREKRSNDCFVDLSGEFLLFATKKIAVVAATAANEASFRIQ